MTQQKPASRQASPDSYNRRILDALRQIIHALDVYSRRVRKTSDITIPQLVCLHAVIENEPVTAATLSRQVSLSCATLVGIIDRLEEKGLINRQRDTRDRRRIYLSATAQGRALAQEAPSPLQDTLVSRLRHVPEAEQATMASSLESIAACMQPPSPNNAHE